MLEGKNDHNGPTNAFGTIAFETDNIELNVIDSTIKASGSGDAPQVIFGENKNATTGKDNKITVTGGEFAVKPEGFVSTNDTLDITIGAGVNSNILVPEEYLAEGVETVKNPDGTVTVVEKYNITISEVKNGTVKTDKKVAVAGEIVTLTITPEESYKLKSVKANGEEVKANKFIMPNKDVTVEVEFELEKSASSETTKPDANSQPVANVDSNPKTGDGILTYGIIGVIALLGLGLTFKHKRTS